ncbi:hypothetical protein [Kribbella ginsengisoli]|uniref:Uncharacterized protein n=1 Tax=Kribbella ginsengisoli TaxID=363865 RepID=A0ABP6X328_9ACTN
MKMKKPRLSLVFISTTALLATFLSTQAQTASAWASDHCQFTTGSLKWQDLTTRTTYSNAAANAIAAWNATPTNVYFTKVTSGTNVKLTDANLGTNGPIVVTNKTCSNGFNATATDSTLNRAYNDGYSSTKKKAYFVFQIGYALGLAPTSAASCPNIEMMYMPTAIDVCGYSDPRPGDITGINTMY